jgi:hypothetical protein
MRLNAHELNFFNVFFKYFEFISKLNVLFLLLVFSRTAKKEKEFNFEFIHLRGKCFYFKATQ